MSSSGGRSFLASAVGWLIVIIVAYVLFGGIFGAIRFIFRAIVFLIIIGALFSLYLKLRGD